MALLASLLSKQREVALRALKETHAVHAIMTVPQAAATRPLTTVRNVLLVVAYGLVAEW